MNTGKLKIKNKNAIAGLFYFSLFFIFIYPAAGESGSIPGVDYMWVELGPQGKILARAITPGKECPKIKINQSLKPMVQRGGSPGPEGFQGAMSCEYRIPSGTKRASINGRSLALPKSAPKRILVMGDTGCRMTKSHAQNCNNVEGAGPPWPFRQVAEAAVKMAPDLIIHVGDYYYREEPCPAGNEGCKNSPYGDNWATWKADFFQPAAALLPRAPWVYIRGNHEKCKRGWKGWFHYLDPNPLPDSPWETGNCQKYTKPYSIPLGDIYLAVMDTSALPGSRDPLQPEVVKQYAGEFETVNSLIPPKKALWLLTHGPIWAASSWLDQEGAEVLSSMGTTLQAALKETKTGKLPSAVAMILSGHLHIFESLQFDDGRPRQFIFGASGTLLDPRINASLLGKYPGVLKELDIKQENFKTLDNFSFALLEPAEEGWTVKVYGSDNKLEASFVVKQP